MSYEHWVGSEGLSFRGRDDAERLGDVVKFHWEAVAKDGEAFGVGLWKTASGATTLPSSGGSTTGNACRLRGREAVSSDAWELPRRI